jgi:hypothetical protein
MTVGIAVMLGGSISYMFDISLTKCILGGVILQFIFFAIYNNIMQYFTNRSIDRETSIRITELGKQAAEVQCAHCSEINYVPIRISADNSFDCTECSRSNAIYLSVTTAQKTTPLDVSQFTVNTLIEEKLAATRSLSDG